MSDAPTILYHVISSADWQQALATNYYAPPSVELEGFIHCSGSPDVALAVGNRYYRDVAGDFVVLLLDESKVTAPVQWDPVRDTFFPHIYGPMNLDAVVQVVPFPRDAYGEFLPLPI